MPSLQESLDDNPQRTAAASKKRNGEYSNDILESIIQGDVKRSAEKLKSTFMDHVEKKLADLVDGMVESLEKGEYQPNSSLFMGSYATNDKRKSRVAGKLPEKEFRLRPSPLTELLEVPHFKTIHHIFIATLVLFMINIITTELLESGTVDLGMEGFVFAFGKPQLTLAILTGMHFASLLLVYPAFSIWFRYRQQAEKAHQALLDCCGLSLFVTFIAAFIYIPASVMWKFPLPPASGATVTMEQCRLLMKIYAFVRSNAPKALNPQKTKNEHVEDIDHGVVHESEDTKIKSSLRNRSERSTGESNSQFTKSTDLGNQYQRQCPEYSKYLYFLFAPTLIYMDHYPRTRRIRWDVVVWNFAQVCGCVWYINFIVGRCCTSYFAKFGHPDHPLNLAQFLQIVFSLMLPGIMTLVLGFFLLLHAWHNAFAEILCFGDRLFYKDWWNCSSFASYYKTWNIIVHDWLYTYVFKDAWEFGLGKKHSAIPTTLVFVISSLFHEYILSFTFNFFFPVLLTLFGGFGFALFFIKSGQNAVGNILMWMGLMAGTGIVFAMYGFEYFARRNCPPPDEISAWDFFKPRAMSLSCGFAM